MRPAGRTCFTGASAHARVRRWIASLSLAALALAATAGPAPLAAQDTRARVTIPRDRLERMVPDSVLREGVAVFDTLGGRRVQLEALQPLALQPGEFAMLRTGDEATSETRTADAAAGLPPEAIGEWRVLPYRYVTPDATGTGTWVLRPIYKVANQLRWQPDQGVFRGEFFLAVEDSLRLGESRPLPAPVRFQLLSDADTVTPEPVAIEHTNFPLQRVLVIATRVSDSLRVHVVPEFDVRGLDVWIPVEPAIVIETTPRRIQGWGIQRARVVVRVIGATAPASMAASLTASEGTLDTLELPIGAAGIGTASLRSEGIGEAVLVASSPGLGQATTTIDFTFPWIFLLAALLGGIFGGIAAAAAEKKERRKARWGEFALKGVFAGLLAALAWYALGVNLLSLELGVPRFNELAVFALAALAGYFGVPRTAPARPA